MGAALRKSCGFRTLVLVSSYSSNARCCSQSLAFAEWRDNERGGRGTPPRFAIPWFPGLLYSVGFLYLALRGVEITLYTEAEYGVIQPALEPVIFPLRRSSKSVPLLFRPPMSSTALRSFRHRYPILRGPFSRTT